MAEAYLLLDDLLARWGQPIEERRKVWEQILTLDESIPAFHVAQVEVRKRMDEVSEARA
jgi:hypothetical protein